MPLRHRCRVVTGGADAALREEMKTLQNCKAIEVCVFEKS